MLQWWVIHILCTVPAVKISPAIVQKAEHSEGISVFIFRFFIPMFAYLVAAADYMAYETVAFRQITKYRVLGIGIRIIVYTWEIYTRGWLKSISQAPFSCFSERSTSTLFSNIQISEGYSDFLVALLSLYTSVNSPKHSEYPYFFGSTALMNSSEQSAVLLICVTMFPLQSHCITKRQSLKKSISARLLPMYPVSSPTKKTHFIFLNRSNILKHIHIPFLSSALISVWHFRWWS